MFVAGMLANTAYHMQASVQLQNGITATDVDHTFTSGTPLMTPNLSVVTTPGMTPQPGLEELTLITPARGIVVTDLQGNTVWSYVLPSAPASDDIEGVKLLPNGHFLITIGQGSSYSGTAPGIIAVREIDLAGNIVREPMANGDLEYDLAGVGANSDIFEVTPDNANPTTVWHMHVANENAYRGFRIPSLYPGVQW